MKKMKVIVLIITGTMITGIIGPTVASANELIQEKKVMSSNQLIENKEIFNQRSLREIENDIETKIKKKGYTNKEEYNMAIGRDFPVEESVYYNNLEYYNAAAISNENGEKSPAILALFGAKVLFKSWAKGAALKFVKYLGTTVAGGVIYDKIKKVGNNGYELVTVEGQYVGPGYYLQGHPVHVLQKGLRDLGYNISVDGYYGPATAAALKSFQRDQGLKADGICGRDTWRKLFK